MSHMDLTQEMFSMYIGIPNMKMLRSYSPFMEAVSDLGTSHIAWCRCHKLYANHGCVVVSPNYRLAKERTPETVIRCAMDAAMAVAHIQQMPENTEEIPKNSFHWFVRRGFISAWIAYQKDWQWPEVAKHKPKKLNIIGWFGDSPFLPAQFVNQINGSGPPAFYLWGKREHPGTPTSQGYDIREAFFNQNKIWNKNGSYRLLGTCAGSSFPI